MKVGIVGLGLIGSSIARAIQKYTDFTVIGFDCNETVLQSALADGVADIAGEAGVCSCDLVFVCLFPEAAVEFILNHRFSHIVCDVCGVKRFVTEKLSGRVPGYVGVHPMAGKETSGYPSGDADLFRGASLIITADKNTDENHVQEVIDFAGRIGFEQTVVTSPEKHDQVIAYTSQLAHVVSSAYVKSDTAPSYVGYSAGSFADLTRVARLDPNMWAELFLENGGNLAAEIDNLVGHLLQYKSAIAEGDRDELFRLLKEGRDKKEMLDTLKNK